MASDESSNKKDRNDSIGSLSAGTALSHFNIIKKLGSGGMGEVYLAEDTKLQRSVALKLLPRWMSMDREPRERLLREAQAAARLNHPNIVSTYAIEEADGHLFIVMEYVEGNSLRELARGGKLAIERIIEIACQVSKGLAEAHCKGIVHRDIKSENVVVTSDGLVKIMDFGLARLKGVRDVTRVGSTLGTMAYMSPEQIQNEAIDQRSDIYSFGVVLYELIGGRLPFSGEYEAAIVYSIVNEAPEPLGRIRSDIPDALERIVSKAMEKDRNLRYQSISELMGDLTKLMQGECPVAFPEQTRKSRMNAIIMIASALVLVAALGFFLRLLLGRGEESVGGKKMIAVLPFMNQGPPEEKYFADGITDEITTRLSKYDELGVISRTSTRQYENTNKPIRQIATELHVDYILEGSVFWDKTGNVSRVRINPQLIDVRKDIHLWAEPYKRDLDQIFTVQADIAEKVAREIMNRIPVTAKPLPPPPTEDLQAYDYYLQGNYYFNHSWGETDYRKAIQMYMRAVELDPNFALAHVMLSRVHANMFLEYYDRSYQRLDQSKQAADKALQIQPNLPEGHLALGMYYYTIMRTQPAMEQFEIAREDEPNNPDLLAAIAGLQRRQGKFDEAIENYKQAFQLEPLSRLRAFDTGLSYGLIRDYPQAETYMIKATTMAPDWPLPYIYRAWIYIFWKGSKARAREILDEGSAIADLSQTEYYRFYWLLSSIIDDNYDITLKRITMVSDTASYYLYKARVYHLMNNRLLEQVYFDSARSNVEPMALAWPDDPRYLSKLGLALAGLGRKAEAVRYGKRAVDLLPPSVDAFDGQFLVANLAEIYVLVGAHDDAIDQLKFLLSVPGFTSVQYLRLDPIWAPLRDNPRFKVLLATGK
jgi:TolB-like protein/predicted Ser/Thr protein kinase/Flp pilus assembly protein TadD